MHRPKRGAAFNEPRLTQSNITSKDRMPNHNRRQKMTHSALDFEIFL
ncbi:hypothetical protein NBRC111894_1803 [Sporolactobacillus inulinus]|uniref:Uncharacterized protein n=1 Tax=Sporolactobacillus inulinus TaxID=2078 RepID=A0A4Y1ZB41_9BACL|nr:hypothetical protein NBRC111894_1803 [Sporolactobacillus inulinus]